MADSDLWLFNRLTGSLGVFKNHHTTITQPSHKAVRLLQQPVNQAFIYRARGSNALVSSWQKSCGNIGFSLLARRSFLLALKMTSSPNMLRRDLTFIACGNHFSTTVAPFLKIFFFFSFSNLLVSPGKRGKSLVFLLPSKNNTSWQVIGSVKCDSLKRGEPPPPAAVLKCERWSRRRFHFDTSTTILFLCHRVPEPTPTSGPPSEGRAEDGCSWEL